jgi:hypothetical protein
MRASALAALLLGYGCADAATTEMVADAARGGSGGAAGAVDARAIDDAHMGQGDASPTDGTTPVDSGVNPPSRRDGGIPTPPPGEPPCAHDSNAGNGNTCPYVTVVGCRPAIETGPAQVCYCFAPPLDGKWHCEDAHDGGGVGLP